MTEQYEVSANAEMASTASDEADLSAGPTGSRTTTFANVSTSIAHAVALRPTANEPAVDASWVATTSGFADGYRFQRWIGPTLDNEIVVTPGTATSAADGPLVSGTTYTYRVIATAGSWRSTPATASFTPGAC